jgi:hypothetical protein
VSDPYVFHFEARHHGKVVERLGTLLVEPAEVRRVGPHRLAKMVETERRRWQRVLVARMGTGWSATVRIERGYVRSRWPGAALRPSPAVEAAKALPVSGGAP